MHRRSSRSERTPSSTTPYFNDNYWKHPENQAIQIFDPGVPFGVPFAPSPFRATFHVKAGAVEVTKELPVEYRYVKDIYFGDKRMELNVVPAFSVRITPRAGGDSGARGQAGQTRDSCHGHQRHKGAAKATVRWNCRRVGKPRRRLYPITLSMRMNRSRRDSR